MRELLFVDAGLAPSVDRSRKPVSADRKFIFWDGEGTKSLVTEGKQNYSLFGNSEGNYLQDVELHTRQMLEFIIEQGRRSPHAFHVGFAFEYDVNMILRNMNPTQFSFLKSRGFVFYGDYRIEHIPHKWFQVTKYGPTYPDNKRDKITVRIADMFGFFQCSFLKAIKSYLKGDPILERIEIIERGKAGRNDFTYKEIETVKEYWTIEGETGRRLADRLREYLYDVNLNISQWHGPGALANYAYRQNNIKTHKAETPPEVYEAARFGYAGGRFERFQIGRFRNGWGIDINSAYPYGISQLPSLAEGRWQHTTNATPENIVEFGIYHIRMKGSPIALAASPLFHRDRAGNISYPWITDGWYWSPEVATLRGMPNVEIIEGYEYVGWKTRPFAFVLDVYNQRKVLKLAGVGSEMALKLLLNSLYGKMAQRVGWERTGGPPTWHQLDWAGWVTSATRAKLYSVMRRIPSSQLIAVETDGIYTTCDPATIGIEHSKELGGWEVTPFDEIRYVQSGMYAKGAEGQWTTKYRGLDARSINAWTIRQHLKSLEPNISEWPMLSGPTTRFVGYRQALWRQSMNMGPMKMHMCKWEHDTKDLSAGSAGKRIHSASLCYACKQGLNAWEAPHNTVIRSNSVFDMQSHKHDIPWLEFESAAWRDYQERNVA
jgi:hypothetical protein